MLPFFDIPFIGLSVTAPLLLALIYYAFVQPATPWFRRYQGWMLIAAAVWLGMVLAFCANGPWYAAREFKLIEIAYLLRYLFWLAVFLSAAFVAADLRIQRRLPFVLGTAVVVLAGLRCFEAVALGKVGAWAGTLFTTQNSYGILFSTFAPFLFPLFLGAGVLRKMVCTLGLIIVLIACAINGSRGSWICITVALGIFSFLAFVSRPGASLRMVAPVSLATLALASVLAGIAPVREAVLGRFSTFENLERDKSYQARQVMNQRSLKLFKSSPWFGTGPGRYREVYVPLEMPGVFTGRSDDEFMRKSPHNSYLSYLAEGGTIGTLPLAFLIAILTIRGAWAASSLHRKGERWGLGLYASFIAMSVHFWGLSGLTNTAPWFVYGLLAATICLASQRRKEKAVSRSQASLPQPRLSFRPYRPAGAGRSSVVRGP